MKIKPLEWLVYSPQTIGAEVPFGIYRATNQGDGYSCCFEVGGMLREYLLDKRNTTQEDAKKSAEAHWQERVKRCLID